MTIVDLSISLGNDVPADPPFRKVHIAYRTYEATEIAAAFPASRPTSSPTARAAGPQTKY